MHHHQDGDVFRHPREIGFQHAGFEEIVDLIHHREGFDGFLLAGLRVVARLAIDRQGAENSDDGALGRAEGVHHARNIIFQERLAIGLKKSDGFDVIGGVGAD